MEVMHNDSLEAARVEMRLLLSEGNLYLCTLGHKPLLLILPRPTTAIPMAQEAEQAVGLASLCF